MTQTQSTQTDLRETLGAYLAAQTYQFLLNSKIIAPPTRAGDTRLYFIPVDDRAILLVDPLGIRSMRAFDHDAPRTAQHLRRLLANRRVQVSNTHGIAIQVAYWASADALKSVPLNLSEQKTPAHIPIGMCENGALWLDLEKAQAMLVAGMSGMGKTSFLHGIIQALIAGAQTRLVLWGGNSGLEFWRYADKPLVQVAEGDLLPILHNLIGEMEARERIFKPSGARNLAEFNAMQPAAGMMQRIALVIDEFADARQDAAALEAAMQLINRGRKVGIHPIIGTQHPSAEIIPNKIQVNFLTRVAFHVPTREHSRAILDQAGAEMLPAKPGRLLITRGGVPTECQAFIVPDVKPATPIRVSSELTEEEINLLSVARDRLGGKFLSEELESLVGTDKNRVNTIAQKLQRADWLTEPQRESGTGKPIGRQLTPKTLAFLAEKSGTGGTAEQAEQAEQGQV